MGGNSYLRRLMFFNRLKHCVLMLTVYAGPWFALGALIEIVRWLNTP